MTTTGSRTTPAPYMAVLLLAAGCASTASTASPASSTPGAAGVSTVAGLKQTKWGANVTLTYSGTTVEYRSNGIPNHGRPAEYAVPNNGVRVPSASTAHPAKDPTVAQNYDFKITTDPAMAATTTSASLGAIGVMISGAVLFNPYEGDGSTVALQSNFTVKDSSGNDVAFLDSCNGHPTPMGQYHYHGLPQCVTAVVDGTAGPSHMIGIAFDGFPIYGNRGLDGSQLTSAQLDKCNGITSGTPEFPGGIYHYVLLDIPGPASSIRCFSGTPITAQPG